MWLCRVFGHKFMYTKGGYVWRSNYCWRCGKPHERIA